MTIKNKGGRPRTPEDKKLLKHTYFLSPDEAQAIRQHCKKANIALSVYIRALVQKDIGLWSADHDNK